MEGGAAHWVEFYDRMIAIESEVLATMEDFAKRLSDEELRAVEITDLEPMRALIAEFKRRANLWREVVR